MTALSQGLNQTDREQTTGDPEAWSGQRSRKPLRGPAVPAVSSAAISMSDQTSCIAVRSNDFSDTLTGSVEEGCLLPGTGAAD